MLRSEIERLQAHRFPFLRNVAEVDVRGHVVQSRRMIRIGLRGGTPRSIHTQMIELLREDSFPVVAVIDGNYVARFESCARTFDELPFAQIDVCYLAFASLRDAVSIRMRILPEILR